MQDLEVGGIVVFGEVDLAGRSGGYGGGFMGGGL